MALRKVLIIGDETLRKISKPVEKFDDNLKILLQDMYDTLKKENGAGLSAVQVGMLRRIFIMELEESGLVEFINPEIVSQSKDTNVQLEGCLSVPEKSGKVERPNKVTVKFQDRNGAFHTRTFTGFEARCVSHENDHLNGIIYVDKIITGKIKRNKGGK